MDAKPQTFIRNFATTVFLGILVFWLGFESAERGVFKLKRDTPQQAVIIQPAVAEAALPTPTPLPAHFPSIAESNLADKKDEYLTLTDAFNSCWPQISTSLTPPDGEITQLEAEKLFGKIKKREILSNSAASTRLGLLFDASVFPGGAAGSATEAGGRWTELQFRAAGRMLHCENPNRCECI